MTGSSALLPETPDLSTPITLDHALSTLLEPSPSLHNVLVPSLFARLSSSLGSSPPTTYESLIDLCSEEVDQWGWDKKKDFLGGHPLIGEVGGLSALSAKEQGGVVRTPEVVLKRLAHLNKLYTFIYPSLPYVTFVNSRPRSAIVTEIEHHIAIPPSPVPLPDDYPVDEPALDSDLVKGLRKAEGGVEWQNELGRGLGDVWRIARKRVEGMGYK